MRSGTLFFRLAVLSLVFWFQIFGMLSAGPVERSENPTIPPLSDLLNKALENSRSNSLSPGEVQYQVRKNYYQIQSQTNQLEIAEEVKGHFEKAVKKSEEKFEKGEEDISQSDITKLKLGLSGEKNDIIELTSEIQIAKLTLGRLTGLDITQESELTEDTIQPVAFPFKDLQEFLQNRETGKKKKTSHSLSGQTARAGFFSVEEFNNDRLFNLKKEFIRVIESRDKLELAKKSRKITRALLVTEVANYDFGIGSSGDLFEALIIYTRVLKGYYKAVYNFNLAVAKLDRLRGNP